MQDESITIILPIPPNILSPNCTIGSIGMRMMKAAATKKYRLAAREAVDAEGIETLPWNLVHVKPKFYYKTKRIRDDDNSVGSLKAAYDGMKDAGLVIDDDSTHMRKEFPDFFVDKENPRVILEIARIK
jgi:Holliday junction resolvase RusA-like endonuclease